MCKVLSSGTARDERENCNFWPDAVAETKTETHAFVHVELRAAIRIEAGSEPPSLASQRWRADSGQLHLPAVRMSAQHQVAALLRQSVDRPGIVGQHDRRNRLRQAGEGALEIAATTPKVVDADDVQRPALP